MPQHTRLREPVGQHFFRRGRSGRGPLRVLLLVALAIAIPALAAPASASAGTATFTYPLNGATNVDVTKPFTWTSVIDAQVYYLYVGTTQGAKDLVDSGEITTTSYPVPKLPPGQAAWARIWTKSTTGYWTYQDVSFTVAPVVKARFSYPLDGAQQVDPAKPFSWYAVDDVQTYYLYVGTTQGAKDLVDSKEITSTSYQVGRLPTGRTLWARIWTKSNNAWKYDDVSFTASEPSRSTFVYPRDGSTKVDTSNDFTWTAVPSAESYYLYIGTSKGSSDLLNAGETSATSYPTPPLPVGQTLWARIWTKVNGSWSQYSDVSFQVAISAARMKYPREGQTDVDTNHAFSWSAAPGAQAYYLKVGTSPGASDLIDSNPTSQTSWNVAGLPVGQKIYARIYTQRDGNWNTYTQVSFTTAYSAAKLSYPAQSGSPNLDTTLPFTWKPVPGASGYKLWFGTTKGASDVLESDLLTGSSFDGSKLPTGRPLWVRLWTLSSGVWLNSGDVSFTPAAAITAPAQRNLSVDPSSAIRWAPGAVLNGRQPTYQLSIGTSPGANDLFDSGVISGTSLTVPSSAMPSGNALYARLKVNLGDGTTQYAYTVFAAAGTSVAPSQMQWGSAGRDQVDASKPFAWSASDLVDAYRLQILNSDGSATPFDSGEVTVPRYFAETLAPGSYTARLGTKVGGSWSWTSEPFTVVHSGASPPEEIDAAHWAVDYLRRQSDRYDLTYGWTPLHTRVNAAYFSVEALCNNYSYELLSVLDQMNVTDRLPADKQPRIYNTRFNYLTTHTVVEFWNSDDNDWILLDSNFDLAMKRASDGHWATGEDVRSSVANRDWGAITYVPLGQYGLSLVQDYYLDYPLYFLNPEADSNKLDPLPYMQQIQTLPTNSKGAYAITADQHPATILKDGQSYQPDFSSADPVSWIFLATNVAIPDGSTANIKVYKALRFVF